MESRFPAKTVMLMTSALMPVVVLAQEASNGSFGPIVAQPGSQCFCPGSAPDWGCVLQTVQNVFNVSISIGVIICILWIAYTGFMLMTSGSNVSRRQLAKQQALKVVTGLVILLSAWIIVDFVMKTVYNPNTSFEGSYFGPWNQIWAPKEDGSDRCIVKRDPTPITSGTLGIITGAPSGSGGGGGGGGGGSCTVMSSGACSTAVLANSCFANRATEAAKICNLESRGGDPAAKSGSDRLNGGSGPSYSVGLWQINLTVHEVNGLKCPQAFTMKCGPGNDSLIGSSKPGACRAEIKPGMERLYQQCVAAAQNPAHNTAVACRLYNESGFQPWSYSANKCGVPK